MTFLLTAVAIGVTVLVATLAQTVTGIGFALVSSAVLATILGPHEGIVSVVAMSLGLNLVMLVRLRRHVLWASALRLLVPAVVTAPLFALAVRHLPTHATARIVGALVIVGTVTLGLGLRAHALRGSGGAIAAGTIASAMNVTAGISAPAPVMYAANCDWSHVTTVATLQAFFAGSNIAALAVLGLPHPHAGNAAAAGAGLAAGLVLAGAVGRRIGETRARRATLLIAAASGVLLLVRG